VSNLHTLKDHFKENRLYLNRTVWASIIVISVFLILIVRLFFLQIYQHELYRTLSLNNQVRIVPIVPPRGLIFDRNGILLAEHKPTFNLELTPMRTSNIEETLTAIHAIIPLSESEQQTFYKQLKYKRRHESVPLRLNLTEEEVAKFIIEKHRFPGVDVIARSIRYYPLNEAVSHVIGYVAPINEKELETLDTSNYRGTYHIGKTGIEKFYETELHGKVGHQHIETDAKGRTIRVLGNTSPIPGKNLHLSLDSKLQQAAFDALGDLKGSVIAIDPHNGEVLALVSKPSFNPNLFTQGIDVKTYRSLQNSPDKPLFNRAISAQYPPGSTIKPLVALQGLDSGIITTQFKIWDPGWYQLGGKGRLYRDMIYFSKKHGHDWVDVEKAIVQSCDTFFFSLAHKLGVHRLEDIFKRFGLGKKTQIDMAGEAGGLVPSEEWKQRTRNEAWYPGDTLNIGIGQGTLLATPLQLAQMTAILASKGEYYKTHLVKAFSETGQTPIPLPINKETPVILKHNEYWDTVIQSMRKVIHEPGGTAHSLSQGIRYQMAGKTGTAQVFNLKQNEKYEVNKVKDHLRDHSWFIAFAPVNEPKIAICVLIENKHKKSAKEIARIVLDCFFEQENLRNPSPQLGVGVLQLQE